eukprot:6172187-Pleurochrysis_carterae.AAC.1
MSSLDFPTPPADGSPPVTKACCNFASITHCDADGLGGADLRKCHQCGENGMHHHFCANDEKTAHAASDPGGPGTSLCAVCSGLQSDEVDEVDERNESGYEAGAKTESASAPVVDGPAHEVQADEIEGSTAGAAAPDAPEQPDANVSEAVDDTEGVVEGAAPDEQPVSDKQDFPDTSMGEDGNRLPSGVVTAEGSGNEGLTASVIQCDRRIRVGQRPDDGPCTGL